MAADADDSMAPRSCAAPAEGERSARWADTVPDRAEQHARKRRAIVETAAALFNEKGFHATSLNELAERLSVTKGALYHYVAGKDDIALEILRINTEESAAGLEAAARAPVSGLERLRMFFVHYAAMMASPVGACAVQIGTLPHSAQTGRQMTAFFKETDQRLRAILQDGIADGSIGDCDVRMTDFAVFGALHWLSRWYRPSGNRTPEELGEALFEVFARGLRPRGADRADAGDATDGCAGEAAPSTGSPQR
jgi:AcrR family transcriptional regulator